MKHKHFPMNLLTSVLLHISLLFIAVAGDTSPELDYPQPDYTNLKPSLAIVIAILSVMFLLTFLLLVFAKFCHTPPRPTHLRRGPTLTVGSSDRFSGIDKTAIESLPFFRFSALRGSREGLECSVCLSKFEDVEILRLLPKCKHAFHIDCIDHWLERHSSCPLCRHRVTDRDLALVAPFSNSLRFLNHPGSEEPGGLGLFVEREESARRGSFRKAEEDGERLVEGFHKRNHRILVPEFTFKARWSNVSSSDLITLRSEMLLEPWSGRFSSKNDREIGTVCGEFSGSKKVVSSSGEQRSMSDITGFRRSGDCGAKAGFSTEERVRRVWLGIAKRTVQWYANRERVRADLVQNQPRVSLHV